MDYSHFNQIRMPQLRELLDEMANEADAEAIADVRDKLWPMAKELEKRIHDEVDEANDVIISTRLIFADYNEIFAVSAEPIDGDAFYPWIVSLDTIRSLDTRVSWDLVCSLPSDSKYECLQSKGNLKRVTARFPVGDMIQSSNVWRSSGGFEITESVHIGIEDVCRGNPDTQTLNLHTGEIRTINSELLVRYMDNKTIKTVPAVMGSTGFWSALLLFSKRIK